MNCYIRFFLGTPRRFLATLVAIVIGMMVVHFRPGTVESAANRLVGECSGLIVSLAMLLIVLTGFRKITGLGGGKKK